MPQRRIQTVVANTIVGQMLPDGVVKGGTGLKLRIGEDASRFTPDLDAAFGGDVDAFQEAFTEKLAAGWGADGARFAGKITRQEPAKPVGVPGEYLMQPFSISLTYNGKAWGHVDFELGHDELDGAEHADLVVAADLVTLFAELGLPAPGPIPVLPLEYQLAQKLHALTTVDGERAHDLVDIQLLMGVGTVNIPLLRGLCERTFRYRGKHKWPPVAVVGPTWPTLYSDAAEGVAVIESVEDAVVWVNELISEISAA